MTDGDTQSHNGRWERTNDRLENLAHVAIQARRSPHLEKP